MMRFAIHNPIALAQEQRRRQFVARTETFDSIITAIEQTPGDSIPQHRLITGAIGSGKSMMLARLSDELEARGIDRSYHRAPHTSFAAKLAESPANRRVLLIDELDVLLDGLGEGTWQLRESLSSNPDTLLIGTSRTLPESIYHYDGAFFDFFAIDRLEPLQPGASSMFAIEFAQAIDASTAARALDTDGPRRKAISLLTFGNLRALTSAGEALLVHGPDATATTVLDHVTDRLSPSFERRLDAISPQASVVLADLAAHWHPAHAKTIAARLDVRTNRVSTYLDRLSRDGLVEKVSLPPGKVSGFQLKDRLFNLWFMRRGDSGVRARADALIKLAAGASANLDTLRDGVPADAVDAWLAPELRALLADQ